MIQGILAIILLGLAVALYFWGRRSVGNRPQGEHDPDIILGLADSPAIESTPQPKGDSKPAPAVSAPIPPITTQPIIREILFLRSPPGRPYGGYELLQSLVSCSLQFGENKLFHRCEHHAGGSVILFSVASTTKTGELNGAEMGDFTCSGLVLFLTLNQHIYPSVHFELMLDTARQLSEDLGGVLLDENQRLLTQEKVQQIREKIKQFETSQSTMELFA